MKTSKGGRKQTACVSRVYMQCPFTDLSQAQESYMTH